MTFGTDDSRSCPHCRNEAGILELSLDQIAIWLESTRSSRIFTETVSRIGRAILPQRYLFATSLSLRSSQSGYVVIQAGILDEAVKFVRREVDHGCQLPELATGDLVAAIRLEGKPKEAMTEFVSDD